ncbi:hypothetical protein MRX96_041336 [Rhipicephalus microplus]
MHRIEPQLDAESVPRFGGALCSQGRRPEESCAFRVVPYAADLLAALLASLAPPSRFAHVAASCRRSPGRVGASYVFSLFCRPYRATRTELHPLSRSTGSRRGKPKTAAVWARLSSSAL